jgi:DNA-directed RNA polymerase sigma subunit (sigma70/sigma32)
MTDDSPPDLLRKDILERMSGLSSIEEQVLRLRFGLENGVQMSLAEVGLQLNMSREQARRIEALALRRLR